MEADLVDVEQWPDDDPRLFVSGDTVPAESDLVVRVLGRMSLRLGIPIPLDVIGEFLGASEIPPADYATPSKRKLGEERRAARRVRPVTRERVRQIEASALRKLRRREDDVKLLEELSAEKQAARPMTVWPEQPPKWREVCEAKHEEKRAQRLRERQSLDIR
jgi:hypothetical protein